MSASAEVAQSLAPIASSATPSDSATVPAPAPAAAAAASLTPITVFSGFLGAGKTTILLSLLEQLRCQGGSSYRVAWLKNEVGSVEVDSKLAAQSGLVETKEILNGCICCTQVGQLSGAITDLLTRFKPDRILLETSGSSHPAPLVWELKRIAAAGTPIELDALINVIDAVNFPGYKDKGTTARLQCKYTDLILINKHELVRSEHDLDRVMDDVFELNPDTPKIKTQKGTVPVGLLIGLDSKLWSLSQSDAASASTSSAQPQPQPHSDDDIHVLDLTGPADAPFTWSAWLSLLRSLPADAFYRVKGMILLTDSQPKLVSVELKQAAAMTPAASSAPAATAATDHPADCSCSSHPAAASVTAAASPHARPHLLNFAFGRFDLTPFESSYAGPTRVSFMGDNSIGSYRSRIAQALGIEETPPTIPSPPSPPVSASSSDLSPSPAPSSSPSPAPPAVRFSFASLILVYSIVVADGIALNIITPFISRMCTDRFSIPAEHVGLASGWIVGVFSCAVFLSSFFIGHLSDIYGRKRFMLLGLASGCVCTVAFGVSNSFGLALVLRFLAGVTNGNLALTKTVIADVPSSSMSNEQRSLAFAYLGGLFQLARALASAIAGLTYGIDFGSYDNPYLLPCVIAGAVNLVVLLLSWKIMPETLSKKKKQSHKLPQITPTRSKESDAPAAAVAPASDVETGLNGHSHQASPGNGHMVAASKSASLPRRTANGAGAGKYSQLVSSEATESAAVSPPSPSYNQFDASASPPETTASSVALAASSPSSASPSPPPSSESHWRSSCRHVWSSLLLGLSVVWHDMLLRKLITLQCMHAFANGSFILLVALFGALSTELHGMDFTPASIGVCYVLFGGVSLFFQLCIYKHAHRRWGLYRVYLGGTILLGVAAAMMPFAGYIKRWEQGRWAAAHPDLIAADAQAVSDSQSDYALSWTYLGLSLAGMATGFMVCLPVVGAMMSHAVQGSAYRGLTLGVGQSLMSGFRGLGAAVMGALFSWVALSTRTPGIVLWMLMLLNLSCFAVAARFKPEELKRITGHKEETAEAATAAAAATHTADPNPNDSANASAAAVPDASQLEESRVDVELAPMVSIDELESESLVDPALEAGSAQPSQAASSSSPSASSVAESAASPTSDAPLIAPRALRPPAFFHDRNSLKRILYAQLQPEDE